MVWNSNFEIWRACREQTNEEKVILFADSHDTLFQGGTLVCPSASSYADMYWTHEADVILQADGVSSYHTYMPFCVAVKRAT